MCVIFLFCFLLLLLLFFFVCFFLLFLLTSSRIGFDISCKLSPWESNGMECRNSFSTEDHNFKISILDACIVKHS